MSSTNFPSVLYSVARTATFTPRARENYIKFLSGNFTQSLHNLAKFRLGLSRSRVVYRDEEQPETSTKRNPRPWNVLAAAGGRLNEFLVRAIIDAIRQMRSDLERRVVAGGPVAAVHKSSLDRKARSSPNITHWPGDDHDDNDDNALR